MEAGLRIKYRWHDIDVLEVVVSVSNGEFSGAASMYVNHDDIRNSASILRGFPANPDDARKLSFGTMDPTFAGGGLSLGFSCKDASGHAVVEIQITREAEPESNVRSRPPQSAHFYADVEAAAIDDFVRELAVFDPVQSPCAFLALSMAR